MSNNKIIKNYHVFLAVMLGLALFVLSPGISGIAWGCLLAFLWRPVYSFLYSKRPFFHRPGLASAVSMILLLFCFTIPFAYALHTAASELADTYHSLTVYVGKINEGGLPIFDKISEILPERFRDIVMPFVVDRQRIASFAASAVRSAGSILRSLSEGVLRMTGQFFFQGFIAAVTMFFLLRDGRAFVSYIKDFLPMQPDERDRFVESTGHVMSSVAYGTIITVAVQAMLGGIAWAFLGLDRAFLASGAMFFFGMFPMGTALVWLPASLFLMLSGEIWSGLALMLWGGIVISMADNLLRPIFIGQGSSIPTFALLIGLTCGVAVWGFIGVFLGPLTLAAAISALDIYKKKKNMLN